MRVIIPAEGKGTRLQPLTNSMAKTLIPVNGVPLLQRILQALYDTHVEQVIISFNASDSSIQDFLCQRTYPFPVELVEGKAQSSLRSFWDLSRFMQAPFIMIDADLVVPVRELRAFVRAAPGLDADVVVGVTAGMPSEIERAIWVERHADGAITVLGRGGVAAPLRTVGSYYWTPLAVAACERYLEQGMTSLAESLKVLSRTHSIRSFEYTGSKDVNTVEDLVVAEDFIKKYDEIHEFS